MELKLCMYILTVDREELKPCAANLCLVITSLHMHSFNSSLITSLHMHSFNFSLDINSDLALFHRNAWPCPSEPLSYLTAVVLFAHAH